MKRYRNITNGNVIITIDDSDRVTDDDDMMQSDDNTLESLRAKSSKPKSYLESK